MPHASRRHATRLNATGKKPLQFESLEDRRLLAITVDTPLDVVNPGDGLTSLREAVAEVNTTAEDTIDFDPSLSGGTIPLGLGQLSVSQPLTIDASGLTDRVTIDAQQNSRVLNFTNATGDLTLTGLTLTGGRTTDDNADGGGVRFASSGTLTLIDSEVSGNETTGEFADGGGVYSTSGSIALLRSTISGNTSGDEGGGVYSASGAVTVDSSTINGNQSVEEGGGVATAGAPITIRNSTVSGNTSGGGGGGLFTTSGAITISDSTVVGNTATGVGGGLLVADPATGGNQPLLITNSIVAENTGATAPDLRPDPGSTATVMFSLIGDGVAGLTVAQQAAISGGAGNLLSVDPMLAPLADNGGPTLTHAPQAGSPVLSAGSANSRSDQRGLPRALGAGPEIGALETLGVTPTLPGDYNRDNTVDAADYTVWRDGFGQTGLTLYADADGDGDGQITLDDYDLWLAEFGETFTPGVPPAGPALILAPATEIAEATTNSSTPTSATDAVFAQLAGAATPTRGALVSTSAEDSLSSELIETDDLLLLLTDRLVAADEEEGPPLIAEQPTEEATTSESQGAFLEL